MSKKDYEKAATIAQDMRYRGPSQHAASVDAFVALFIGDNPRFSEERFRRACVPGANVKARS